MSDYTDSEATKIIKKLKRENQQLSSENYRLKIELGKARGLNNRLKTVTKQRVDQIIDAIAACRG